MCNTSSSKKCILLTGGAGYIGSHTAVELLQQGYHVSIVDNLSNSCEEAVDRVRKITGKEVAFYKGDLCSYEELLKVFEMHKETYGRYFDGVIHFAAKKAVGESVEMPLEYYHNNITSSMNLLRVMEKCNCKQLVFSSTAAVYGNLPLPLTEELSVGAGITNPYGRSKYMIEEMLRDLMNSPKGKTWSIVILRYFNPVGAHVSGCIGEDPRDIPNNLMPYVTQVAIGIRKQLTVFGDQYSTPDGTGVRDYIHVVDLALGHVAALGCMEQIKGCLKVYNLGSGTGYSVLEIVSAMEKASGRSIPYQIGQCRPGDVGKVIATPTLANKELNWKTVKTIHDICKDQWKWQQMNPNGY